VQSGTWEIIADTLYWIQLVWVLSGFVLMAYLALRVFPWRDETQNVPPSRRVLGWQTEQQLPLANVDSPLGRIGKQTITAGSYRFDWNYARPADRDI